MPFTKLVTFTSNETDNFSQDLSQSLTQNLNIFSQSFYLSINDPSQDMLQNMSQSMSQNLSQNMSQSASQSFVVPPGQKQAERVVANSQVHLNDTNSSFSTHGGSYFDSLSLLLGVAQNMGDIDHSQYSQVETSMISQSTQLSNQNLKVPQIEVQEEYHVENSTTGESIMETLNKVPFRGYTPGKSKRLHRANKKDEDDKVEKYLRQAIREILESNNNILDSLSDDQLALKVARKLKSKSFSRLLKRVENILPKFGQEDF